MAELMSNAIPKILLITYAFPPLQAAESFLSLKALSNVESHTVDILTIDVSEIGLERDDSLKDYSLKYFGTVYRVTPPFWITSKAFAKMRFFSFFPDRFRFFNKAIYKKGIEIGVSNYDLVISWSQWHSVHLVALKLKKVFPSTPWLAHLSDPWADNPFLTWFPGYFSSQYLLERSVIKNADAVNFTTNSARMLVMKKYPASWINKTYITPHSFDETLYPKNRITNRGKVLVNYLGNFYGPRNPINFIKALEIIYEEEPNFFNDVIFRFVGRWIGNENWEIERNKLPVGLIEVSPPISYLKSLAEMKRSDILLILDAPFSTSVFFPSKLVDYIGSGKPILAFTPNGSCLDILTKLGGEYASPENVESIALGLRNSINKLRDETFKFPENSYREKFSNKYVSRKFEILFKQLINN
jgi:glycosyltransferase involved in cell wall biosynthesis